MNTDKQALDSNLATTQLALGESMARGLGTGGDPERGYAAAKESDRAIMECLEGADMVFVTAGMGGGTGTGAAPYIAEIAKRMDVLTVGVVTRPFAFEGSRRKSNAALGLGKLKETTDTLIVIPNDNLMNVVEKKTSMSDAFLVADDVLRQGVQGISDIVLKPGLINVDFADVRSVMKNAGLALMGLGHGVGESRARVAAEMAANSPLLDSTVRGAKRLLVNITAGPDFAIGEAHEAMEYLLQLTDADDASIFMGQVVDESMMDEVKITVLAAGLQEGVKPLRDAEVFDETKRSTREPAVEPSGVRGNPKPIELDELDLDIPSFLRRQRLGN